MKSVYAAFVKAQKGFAPALKTSTNPHFKSKYADLSACVEAVIDSLNEHGIGLVQRTHADDSGVTVETVFVHESGESFSGGVLHVPASKQDPQGYGSALSYARRYSLMAACGIAPEDDDGNAAVKAKRTEETHADPLALFPPHAQAAIRKTAAAAIEAFNEGKEYGAFEEVASMLDKYPEGDARNQVRLALWAIFKPHSALRASLKASADRERAGATA